MKKILIAFGAGIVAALIVVLLLFSSPLAKFIYSENVVSSTEAVLKAFEKQGKLQVIKMYLEQVHKEEIVRDLFGIGFLAPNSRTLVAFTSVATACIDLTKVTEEDILYEGEVLMISLPEPELCDDPYIIPESFHVYDQNLTAMILDPQQEITAQTKAIGLASEKALNNDILKLARDQGESVMEKFLSAITNVPVSVSYR